MPLLVPRYRPLLSRRAVASAGYLAPPVTSGLVLDVRSHLDTYQDTSFATPAAADTDPIDGWKDQSGGAHHLLGAGTTTRPILKLAQVNGKPSVRFDGSNDRLKALFTLTTFDLFCVIKQITWTSGDCLFAGGAGDNFSLTQNPGGSSPGIQVWNGSGSSGNNSGLTLSTWMILQVQFPPGAASLFTKVNAVAAVTGSGSNPSAARGGLSVASHPTPSSFANAEYAAILLYNTALSTGDAALVRNFLNGIYACF